MVGELLLQVSHSVDDDSSLVYFWQKQPLTTLTRNEIAVTAIIMQYRNAWRLQIPAGISNLPDTTCAKFERGSLAFFLTMVALLTLLTLVTSTHVRRRFVGKPLSRLRRCGWWEK